MRAIRLLAGDALCEEQLALLGLIPEPSRYEYTGSGYFLTLAHQLLPAQAKTLSFPAVVGRSGDVTCGFVVFLGERELTLECHPWGAIDIPSNFRELPVDISIPSANVVGLR